MTDETNFRRFFAFGICLSLLTVSAKVVTVPGEAPEPLKPLPSAEREVEEIAPLLNPHAILSNQATEAAIAC